VEDARAQYRKAVTTFERIGGPEHFAARRTGVLLDELPD
jgi:hypothetical protein